MNGIPFHKYTNITPTPFLSETKDINWDESFIIFNEYNIPYFLDKKRDILSNPLIVLIISSLEILTTNWSYESVFKYVKSGLINLEVNFIDKLENYILANGIKGYKFLNTWRKSEDQ